MRNSQNLLLFTLLTLAGAALPLHAQTPVATYRFNNTLNADETTAPALTATDPQNASGYGSDTVFGETRGVYNFSGNTTPSQQAGLTLDTTGLVSGDAYSAEMVFKFTDRSNGWRRILDTENRQSDNGFYVNPSNNLTVYPLAGSTNAFTTNVYHHIVLTDAPDNTVKGYLDGTLQFTYTTDLMRLDRADNPGHLLNFFLDNTVGGGQGEYSSGSVALARIYNGVLSDDQVLTLSQHPFASATPAPGALWVALIGAVPGLLFLRRRR